MTLTMKSSTGAGGENKKCSKKSTGPLGTAVSPKRPMGVDSESGLTNKNNCDNSDSDVITTFIGHYGLWQFFWTLLLCLFQLPCTFHIFALVFQSANRDFWCARPSHLKDLDVELWKQLTQPEDGCTLLQYDYGSVTAENFSQIISTVVRPGLIKCDAFEFDGSLIGNTIISEWNLVCDGAHLTSFVEMCFLAGAAMGSVGSGWVSDRFGRKHTLMSFALIQGVCGLALAFQTSLTAYMVLRFIIGLASMSVVVTSFVLVVELVSGTYRTVIGILNIFPVALAYIMTAGISYLAYDWRTMQFYITIPCMVLLCIWYHLPESPRWLYVNDHVDQLKELIITAAQVNGHTLPDGFEIDLVRDRTDADTTRVSILDLFRRGYCRITLLMIIVWFSLILIYFGITLHMSNLGGNIYINTIIAGGVEAVSILLSILVVLKLGLRINLFMYMLIAGIACIMVNFAPDDSTWLVIGFAMIVKCAIGANNAIIPTFTAMQYPTEMRNLGVGVGNFAAGMALIVVPNLWLLEKIQVYLPMTIMGVVGIVGAIALFLMNDMPVTKSESRQTVVVAEHVEDLAFKANKLDGSIRIGY